MAASYDSSNAYDSVLLYGGAHSLTIIVGGTDVSGKVLVSGFSITQVLTRRGDTASFTIVDTSLAMTFAPFAAVTIDDANGNRKFGGVVTRLRQKVSDGPLVNLWLLTCQDYTFYLQKTLGNKKYQASSVDAIAKDLLASFPPGVTITTNNVQANLPTLAYFNCNHLRLSDAFDKLIKNSNTTSFLMWDVDPNKDLHFFDQDHVPVADVTLVDTAPGAGQANYLRGSFAYERDASQLVNQITFRGGTYVSNPYVQTWVGNGQQASYVLDYQPDTSTQSGGSTPTVTVAGVAVSVGLDTGGGFGSHAALVSVDQTTQAATLRMLTAPVNGATVTATYVYDIPVLVRRKDAGSVYNYGTWEEYVVDTNVKTQQAAAQRAGSLLSQYAKPLSTASADVEQTYVGALGAGQLVTIVNRQIGLNLAMICTDCRISGMPGGYYRHSLTLAQFA